MPMTPPKEVVLPDNKDNIWCPFCDWHATDSYTTRKRMGLHMGSCHREAVAYRVGTEPADLAAIQSKDG